MKRSAVIAGLASALLVNLPVLANDEPDELIPGKVIVVKSGRQAKVVAKPNIGLDFQLPSAANDPTVEGATLTFLDSDPSGAGQVTFDLDATGWKGLGTPPGSKGFKYKGRDASPVDDVCKRVLLKPNVLKAVCKGDAGSVPLTTPFAGDSAVVLTMGTDSKRYCAVFKGTTLRNDVKSLKRKNAPAPPACIDVAPPSPTPTVTATATSTSTPTDTPTVTPTVTETPTLGSDVGNHLCTLGANSGFELFIQSFLVPIPLDGQAVEVSCGTIDGGTLEAPCTCGFYSDFGVPVVGLGVFCFEAVAGCDDGKVDCNGGGPFALDLEADHNIGSCTGNPDCAAQCAAQCGALEVAESGCEGFCSDGTSACTVDADCAGLGQGLCQGAEPVDHPNVCGCQCLDRQAGVPAAPGALQCNLGMHMRLRQSDCTGSPMLIDFGEKCIGLTTGTAGAVLTDATNLPGNTIGPVSASGAPISCNVLQTSVTALLSLAGHAAYFDTAIGDMIGQMVLQCE